MLMPCITNTFNCRGQVCHSEMHLSFTWHAVNFENAEIPMTFENKILQVACNYVMWGHLMRIGMHNNLAIRVLYKSGKAEVWINAMLCIII